MSSPSRSVSNAVAGALFTSLLILYAFNACQEPVKEEVVKKNPEFVGSYNCQKCHQTEFREWTESHHEKAIQVANDSTVLGDFSNATFQYARQVSRFFKEANGDFMVNTDGADGHSVDFKISYTFGVFPLQQYLVKFPDGKMQALPFAWDARPKEEGGQRWFHLYPDEAIDHRDQLHWTRTYQNWNMMCAECHSTALRKNWNSNSNSYETRWEELSVGCESCHGAASEHIAWSENQENKIPFYGFQFALKNTWSWEYAHDTATIAKRKSNPNPAMDNVCAACHARSSQMGDGWNLSPNSSFLDHHRPTLLTSPLYFPTGEQHDEVYVWNSFQSSKMHMAGVRCGDCHQPHSSKLIALDNALCVRCHQANAFDSFEHTIHQSGSEGSKCVNCHMPSRTYMVVDERRDHSFQIPRPDVSIVTGSPNACTNCHTTKSNEWASLAMDNGYGPNWRDRPTTAWDFDEASKGNTSSGTKLLKIAQTQSNYPSIVRATALALLPRNLNPQLVRAAQLLMKDSSALVRSEAVKLLQAMPGQDRWNLVSPLLTDPIRLVRIEAANSLADINPEQLNGGDRDKLNRAISESERSLLLNSDFPENCSQLGILYIRLRRMEEAKSFLEKAIELDSLYEAGYLNLADFYRQVNDEANAQQIITTGLRYLPKGSGLYYARGLSSIRAGDYVQGIEDLKQAIKLNPENHQFVYVYAIALHDRVNAQEGIRTLQKLLQKQPKNGDLLRTLIEWSIETGNGVQANNYLTTYRQIHPNDPQIDRWLSLLSK